MNACQIDLIRRTFARIADAPEVAALAFYRNLFALEPAVRPLFQTEIGLQGRKLMQMLTVVVDGLERPDLLGPVLVALGQRHVDYGVRHEHYDAVGRALILTLEQTLGPAFTPEARSAWLEAFGWMAETMRSRAADRTTAGAR